jgi:hypothetical protein
MTARRAIGHDAGASVEELAARVERARKDWLIESKALSRLPLNAARAKVESLIVARRQREAERFKSELRVLAAMVGAGAKGANEHWRDQPRVPAGERDAGQWTAEGGGEGDARENDDTQLAQARGRGGRSGPSPARERACYAQYDADMAICRTLRGSLYHSCREQAGFRLSECFFGQRLRPFPYWRGM